MKTLQLKWVLRHGNAQHSFLDFVVSGRSLYGELRRRGDDYVSCLGWLADPQDDHARARLLLERPGDLPSGRVALYICPQCGDLGCGTVSVAVVRDDDGFVWQDFGYESDNGEAFTPLERLGPYRFEAEAYEDAIGSYPKR
ncbi:MAG TPA: hypothetical protein EYH07_03530 [Kiloniellaceae bacterium]|nr:hypothetical protein [Kiloniellaceae bacterium]